MNITLWGTSRITHTILKGLLENSDLNITTLITTNIKTTYVQLIELCKTKEIPVTDKPTGYKGINIVASYGKYIPEKFFGNPDSIFINIHPSLLPKYRGANPIVGAILVGDTKTGVTFHRTVKGMDEGEIFQQFEASIVPSETAYSLEYKLAKLAHEKLPNLLNNLEFITPFAQTGKPSYADRTLVNFDTAHIDWKTPAEKLKWFIQAYFDNPIAWTKLDNKILKIYPGEMIFISHDYTPGTILLSKTAPFVQIACTRGLYTPGKLQLEGKQPVEPKAFYNGYLRFNKTVLE
ncbi:hypothetical protein JW962_04045 [Candidatus Dojkabacteria bacterium]|nr:hypothetical protein [Candidatus Dojkabacteria bacterium]